MTDTAEQAEALRVWRAIPDAIEKAIEGLPEKGLDLRGGPDGWSIRETVHHLVEANLVASIAMIAALAKSGSVFDWSWVTPDSAWMQRMSYHRAPIRPALDMLRGLSEHVATIIDGAAGGLRCEVQLLDAPGAESYTKTVEELLMQEAAHAEGHLRGVADTRARHAM